MVSEYERNLGRITERVAGAAGLLIALSAYEFTCLWAYKGMLTAQERVEEYIEQAAAGVSHDDPAIARQRRQEAREAARNLIKAGEKAYAEGYRLERTINDIPQHSHIIPDNALAWRIVRHGIQGEALEYLVKS